MKKRVFGNKQALRLLGCLLLMQLSLGAAERWQIELFGGLSYTDPRDLNLIPKAEEKYNDVYFVRYAGGGSGYFVNDFPQINSAPQAGIRLRWRLSRAVSLSLAAEALERTVSRSLVGTFSYSAPGYLEEYGKSYDPFRLHLSAFVLLAGVHRRLPAGARTELEIGAAAGWARARFDFSSTWTYTVNSREADLEYLLESGGTLKGDGVGDGWLAQASARLNRALGKRLGFFVEATARYCRIGSLAGGGHEVLKGIPGEKAWEGVWGVKREKISRPWFTAEVDAATNFWESWTAAQRLRDFVLDLSGLRLTAGMFVRF
jgi:hypothetical protein